MLKLTPVSKGLYRGPRPMAKDEWDQLSDFHLVLNLESGVFERSHDRLNEEFIELANRYVTPVHLEMSDIFPPILAEMRAAILTVNIPAKAYVHCLYGVDRTGVICAAWRVKVDKWTPDRAINEMLDLGFHFIYRWWLPAIRTALSQL